MYLNLANLTKKLKRNKGKGKSKTKKNIQNPILTNEIIKPLNSSKIPDHIKELIRNSKQKSQSKKAAAAAENNEVIPLNISNISLDIREQIKKSKQKSKSKSKSKKSHTPTANHQYNTANVLFESNARKNSFFNKMPPINRSVNNIINLDGNQINPDMRSRFKKINKFKKNRTTSKLRNSMNLMKRYTQKQKGKKYLISKLQNSPNKRKSNYLKAVCPNTGLCIGFSKQYTGLIKEFFNNYIGFDNLYQANVLSKSSANGMTSLLKYKKYNYTSDVVLKNIPSIEPFPGVDNLFYEAYVGLEHINKFNTIYPNFLETYGAGYIADDGVLNHIIRKNKGSRLMLQKGMFNIMFDSSKKIQVNEYLDNMCSNLNKQSIFIQTIDKAQSLDDYIKELKYVVVHDYIKPLKSPGFDMSDPQNAHKIRHAASTIYYYLYTIALIMYQIYYTLSDLEYEFVHYDLHTSNVLLYDLPKTKDNKKQFINMNYFKGPNKTKDAEFDITIIPKIIDYGRCYTKNTDEIMNQLEQKECFKTFMSIHDISPYIKNNFEIIEYFQKNGCKIKLLHSINRKQAIAIFETIEDANKGLALSGNKEHVIDGNKTFIMSYSTKNAASFLGFDWIHEPDIIPRNYYISARNYNCSHDLRCWSIVYDNLLRIYNVCKQVPDRFKQEANYPIIRELFFEFFRGKPYYETDYGTQPLEHSGIPSNFKSTQERFNIFNVNDAHKFFKNIISHSNKDYYNVYETIYNYLYQNVENYSTIDIYGNNKQMKSTM